jgi:hypothetical protein
MEHTYTAVRIEDPYCDWGLSEPWIKVYMQGPVFPAFLKANFSTYEGWRYFIEDFGLDGFAALDAHQGGGVEPLGSAIERVIKGEISYLSQHYLECVYKRIRERLLYEQEIMRLFHSWFFKNKQPLVKVDRFKSLVPATFAIVLKNSGESLSIEKEIEDTFWQIHDALSRALNGISFSLGLRRVPPALMKIVGLLKTSLRDFNGNHDEATKTPELKVKFKKLFQKTDWYLVGRKWFVLKPKFDSHVSRCYLEMIEAIQDEVEIKECENCGLEFFPSRKNEIFCSRPSPAKRTLVKNGRKEKGIITLEEIKETARGLRGARRRKTCKEVGPQRRFRKKMEEEGKLEWLKEKKRYLNRLAYLRRKGDEEKYLKVWEEYERWTAQNLKKL